MQHNVFQFIETDTEGEINGAVYIYSLMELRTRLSLQWPDDMKRFEHLIAVAVSAPHHPIDLTLTRDVESMADQTHLTWSARLYYRPWPWVHSKKWDNPDVRGTVK